jgi:acyl-CoA synthetase (AMP-forming)/AMP-acid ligase II
MSSNPTLSPLAVLAQYAPHDYTLNGAFASRARERATHPFLFFNGRTWSWSEFQQASARLAYGLAARGVAQGQRVAIVAGNHPAHLLLMFALAQLRAIIVPVNPEFGVDETRYVLTHAGVTAVVCDEDTHKVVREAVRDLQPAPWFARIDGEGYYYHVGRKKDLIRRRGENISAAEIERVLCEHPAVAEAAALPVAAEVGEEEVMAVIVAKAGATPTAHELHDWCAQHLAAFKAPRYVVFVEDLPHTPTHKVAKHVLKQDTAALRARAIDTQRE